LRKVTLLGSDTVLDKSNIITKKRIMKMTKVPSRGRTEVLPQHAHELFHVLLHVHSPALTIYLMTRLS